MCGIFGVVQADAAGLSVNEYTKLLEHRGPDDHGWLVWHRDNGLFRGRDEMNPPGHVLLGHRRLSILDLSQEGWQPMSSPDDRYHIVFNGEIYNYRELRDELLELGYQFHSQSDTEVLLYAWAEWGKDALPKLIGMFAFAILDASTDRMYLARDHFGIKPLFYSCLEGGFAFSSEISTLTKLPEISSELNPQRVYEYLQYGASDHGNETMLKDIRQLPSAHIMEVNLKQIEIASIRPYWALDTTKTSRLSFEDAAAELRRLFLDSVALHLRSDVPVGAALSGGIDSSAIVCAIRHLEPEAEIHTFTFVAEDDAISESHWADIVGEHVGAIMHKVKPQSADLVRDMDELIRVQDEPFGSSSIYAQNRVFRLAHEAGIKVMLDGQGADEMLAGYPGYVGSRLASQIKNGHWLDAYRFFQNVCRLPGRNRSDIIKKTLGHFVPEKLQEMARKIAGRELVSAWYSREWLEQSGVNIAVPHWQKSGQHCLRQELAASLMNVSIPGLLRYEDRNSMAHSIESRVPFLNWQLVEFVFSLPESCLMDENGQTKAVFREAMRGIVPDVILDRQDKIGFSTPEKEWLRSNAGWLQETLAQADELPMFNAQALKLLWHQVESGERRFDFQVWRCLNFIRWAKLSAVVTK